MKVGCKVIPKQPAFVKASAAPWHLAEGRQDEHCCVSGHLSLDRLDMAAQWVRGVGAGMGLRREGRTMCCNRSCSVNSMA